MQYVLHFPNPLFLDRFFAYHGKAIVTIATYDLDQDVTLQRLKRALNSTRICHPQLIGNLDLEIGSPFVLLREGWHRQLLHLHIRGYFRIRLYSKTIFTSPLLSDLVSPIRESSSIFPSVAIGKVFRCIGFANPSVDQALS